MINALADLALTWAPGACTLPSTERPLREREFHDLLATAVLSSIRVDAMNASFRLRPEPAVAAQVAELAVRETGCCLFFTFALTIADEQLSLAVSVPGEYVGVLDGLLHHPALLTDGTGR